ncbi:hypothetical protein PGSY75_1447200 [Plasmodium gaboni]|uniref:Transcription initiation factor IIF subunit alpha n=1 Tax=Plasmodium gaboni TaxID=647221 RepID=A0A151LAT0_9APIC|nr:hypothetical protein PGSY75_1447200 [Plasmodium gaboni]KYN96063.1 hypothetical protein PGSY75_1447200 [Plasmodium gaboni]
MNEASSDALKYSDFSLSKYGNKRIRINKPEDGTKYFVSRFSDNKELNKLTSPITFICKDEDTDNSSSLNKNNNISTSWVLKNASMEKMRINHKSYVSKKCNLDTDVFFVLIENEEYSDIYPISSWEVFEPNLCSKNFNKFNVDNSEEKLRTQMDNKRIDDIIERLKNKEEQNKLNIKAKEENKKKKKKKKKNIIHNDSSEDFDDDDDDLGLKRQEKRRIKNLIKLKRGDNKEEIEYVNSALSITSLRKSNVNWDYNNDGRKSDDEDLNEEISGQEDFDDDNDDNDDSENNSDNDEYKLTSYGQAMRSLLKQQVNDEEDDELNQYSDDDDEEEEDEEDDEEEDEEDDEDDHEDDDNDDDDDDDDSDDEKSIKKKQMKNNKKIQNEREKDKYKIEKNKKNNNKHFYEEEEQDLEQNNHDNKKNINDDQNEKKKDTPKINQDKTQDDVKRRLSINDKFNKFNEYIKEKIKNKEIQIKEDNCAKIIVKVVEKNNGKMNIMTLLDTLNIREKNESFLIVQKYIKNLCNISSETVNDKKIKTITIKPKYLQKK